MSSQVSSRVPLEWIGRARALRNSIGESTVEAKAQIERLISPLRPKPGIVKMPRHVILQQIRDHWLKLPKTGQLDTVATFDKGKLKVGELRATPTRLRYAGWTEGDYEHSISLTHTLVFIHPPQFVYDRRDAVAFGLHAIARRYERGADKSDAAVLNDMVPLSLLTYEQRAEFEIPVNGGSWVGEAAKINGKLVLIVRTYV